MVDATPSAAELRALAAAAAQPKAFFESYEVGLVPGPTSVDAAVAAAYTRDFASPDLERPLFAQLYAGEADGAAPPAARARTRARLLRRAETQELLRELVGASSEHTVRGRRGVRRARAL